MTKRKCLTALLRGMIWERSKGMCWYCGGDTLKASCWTGRESIDHQTPVAQGGTDDVDNLVLACRSCNMDKHARTVEEYRVHLSLEYARTIRYAIELIEESFVREWSWSAIATLVCLRDVHSLFLEGRITFFGERSEPALDYQI